MAKLILSMDGLVLKEIPLTKERTTIGRKPHNDIQIDNLAVSGEHAVIVETLGQTLHEIGGVCNVSQNVSRKNHSGRSLFRFQLESVLGVPKKASGRNSAIFGHFHDIFRRVNA